MQLIFVGGSVWLLQGPTGVLEFLPQTRENQRSCHICSRHYKANLALARLKTVGFNITGMFISAIFLALFLFAFANP